MTRTKRERAELERPVGTRTGRADAARRARRLLLLADGHTWAEIRGKLDCHDSFIARWSQRVTGERLAGLFGRHAGRARYQVTDRVEAKVLAWTTKPRPTGGTTHWSSRKLAEALGGLSPMTVSRIWAKQGLKPHRLEGYLMSSDPDFERRRFPQGTSQRASPLHADVLVLAQPGGTLVCQDRARGDCPRGLPVRLGPQAHAHALPKPVTWAYFDPTRRITPESIGTGHECRSWVIPSTPAAPASAEP